VCIREYATAVAAACKGTERAGSAYPTAVAKANAEALCPEGRDCDVGIRTQRCIVTTVAGRSGRRRAHNGFTTRLLTAEESPTLTKPSRAARRPGPPPRAAMMVAQLSHNRERFAALEIRTIALSRRGVGTLPIV
jgi:hypothetical protein